MDLGVTGQPGRAPDSGVYYFAVDGYNENLGTYTVRVTDLGG